MNQTLFSVRVKHVEDSQTFTIDVDTILSPEDRWREEKRSAFMSKRRQNRATPAQLGPTGPTTTTQTPVASGDHNVPSVSAEDIRLRAYRKWESAGKPTGDSIRFWLEAEQELGQGK
jgi:hypothetical protein